MRPLPRAMQTTHTNHLISQYTVHPIQNHLLLLACMDEAAAGLDAEVG